LARTPGRPGPSARSRLAPRSPLRASRIRHPACRRRRAGPALRDALPPGSYLGLSHATNDFRTETAEEAAAVYNKAISRATLRSHAQIAAFFGDWDLVQPGLVQVPLWRWSCVRPRHDSASF
jgi:hypothetical protein